MMNNSNDLLIKWLGTNGAVTKELTVNAIKRLKGDWRKKYSRNLQRIKGVWKLGSYDWHVFSYETIECVEGVSAIQKTLTIQDIKWYIWGDGTNTMGWIVAGITPINLTGLGDDYIITGFDFGWTAVFTHELQCGPYYCEFG